MNEVTLKVPAKYVDTLREAAVDEVRFWQEATADDIRGVREARERQDEKKVDFILGDMGDHQRTLGEAGALIEQLPAPGTTLDVELSARARTLESVCEVAARVASKAVNTAEEYSPPDVPEVRQTLAEVGWWLSEYETFSAKRIADYEAEAV